MVSVLKRRYVDESHSTEYYDADTGICKIEYHMAKLDGFRVAPESKIPMPQPFQQNRPPSSEFQSFADSIRPGIEQRLNGENIEVSNYRVWRLVSEFSASRFQDTLVIECDVQANDEKFRTAATRCQQYIDQKLDETKSLIKSLRVEIRDPAKMNKDASSAIEPGSRYRQIFEEIAPRVLEEAIAKCKHNLNTLAFVMRGSRGNLNNRRPSIVLGVEPKSENDWKSIEDHLIKFVEERTSHIPNANLYIEIITDKMVNLIFESDSEPGIPQVLLDLPANPANESSIGPRGTTKEAGTLGTWVNFQPPGLYTSKIRCILTCSHVVASGELEETKRRVNSRLGIGLNGDKRPGPKSDIKIDYPAPFDSIETKKVLREAIEKNRDTEGIMAKSLKIIDQHLSAGGIGTVLYASGDWRRSSKNPKRMMDWALIQIHNQKMFSSNKPVQRKEIDTTWLPAEHQASYYVAPNETVNKVGTVCETTWWVAKKGRTTGITTGFLDNMFYRLTWNMNDAGKLIPFESREILIMPHDASGNFCKAGDLGSMVCNVEKEWIGMVTKKTIGHQGGAISTAEDIIQDIKETTGGTITLA